MNLIEKSFGRDHSVTSSQESDYSPYQAPFYLTSSYLPYQSLIYPTGHLFTLLGTSIPNCAYDDLYLIII